MQKRSTRFTLDEQLVARRWRLGVLAFYGLIIAALLLFHMIGSQSTQITQDTKSGIVPSKGRL
jgi:hypothetical protein